jgi:hypothetical protein
MINYQSLPSMSLPSPPPNPVLKRDCAKARSPLAPRWAALNIFPYTTWEYINGNSAARAKRNEHLLEGGTNITDISAKYPKYGYWESIGVSMITACVERNE